MSLNGGSALITATAGGLAPASQLVQVSGGGGTGGGPAPTTMSFAPTSLTINGLVTQNLSLAPVVKGLKEPTFVTWFPDGSGRMLILERAGRSREAAAEFRKVVRHDQSAFDAAERLANLS